MTLALTRCLALAVLGVTVLAGTAACGTSAAAERPSAAGPAPSVVPAAEVRCYVAAVEKVRLPVNALLNGADPILDARHNRRITAAQASARMDAMERTFAGYLLMAQEIHPSNLQLAALNTPYAATYFDEDSYLATLASDLADGDVDNLPNTQDAQRLAIIEWRTRLEVIAARSGVTLPTDLQQAGRGEIAPDPDGS